LKVNDENSRIRIHSSEAPIRRSGSVPKCHGSTTLVASDRILYIRNADLTPCCKVLTLIVVEPGMGEDNPENEAGELLLQGGPLSLSNTRGKPLQAPVHVQNHYGNNCLKTTV
jgi:hypothetical protein